MALTVVGVSHRTAALEVRERLVIAASEATRTLGELRAATGAREALAVSTCNRTEIYMAGDGDPAPGALAFLSRRLGEPAESYT